MYGRSNKTSIEDRSRMIKAILIPSLWAAVMWGVHFYTHFTGQVISEYGIYPRTFSGLRGVIFSPFIHGDWNHLINNTYPMLILGTALFYFYNRVAMKVLLFGILLTGLWVWAGARESFHIGASGVIYVLAGFIFFSGVFSKHRRMMGLSLVTVFLYGGMVWGVFPIEHRVSWESHLFGLIAGVILAAVFRKEGPRHKKYSWDYDGDRSPIPEELWNPEARKREERQTGTDQNTDFVYRYKPAQRNMSGTGEDQS